MPVSESGTCPSRTTTHLQAPALTERLRTAHEKQTAATAAHNAVTAAVYRPFLSCSVKCVGLVTYELNGMGEEMYALWKTGTPLACAVFSNARLLEAVGFVDSEDRALALEELRGLDVASNKLLSDACADIDSSWYHLDIRYIPVGTYLGADESFDIVGREEALYYVSEAGLVVV
jgi:hypothetical protein